MGSLNFKRVASTAAITGLLAVGGLAVAQPASAVSGLCGDYNYARAINATCKFPIKSTVTANGGIRYEGPAAYRGQTSWQAKSWAGITAYGWARV